VKSNLIFLLGLALAASPAAAAPAATPSADDARMLSGYSQCIASRHRWLAEKLLELDYRSDRYSDRIRALAKSDPNCLWKGSLRFGGVLFAGDLAEALLPDEIKGRTLASATAYDPSRPAVAARDEGEYLGLCTVRTAPEEVASLLATRPLSPEEDAAFRALAPRFGPCLKAGSKAHFNALGLRALIALTAYRMVQQNKAAAPAAGGN
jgi:hypothetical protein